MRTSITGNIVSISAYGVKGDSESVRLAVGYESAGTIGTLELQMPLSTRDIYVGQQVTITVESAEA